MMICFHCVGTRAHLLWVTFACLSVLRLPVVSEATNPHFDFFLLFFSLSISIVDMNDLAEECYYPAYAHDGWCDPLNNIPSCNYDYGDCCESECQNSYYECEINGYYCVDPSELLIEATANK
jgi:hypothetical protein